MALDQGYTEDQATKFATQEALASTQAKTNAKDENIEPENAPVDDNISGLKATKKETVKKGGLYDQEVPKDVLEKVAPKEKTTSDAPAADSDLSI
jgi:hypothetical protein